MSKDEDFSEKCKSIWKSLRGNSNRDDFQFDPEFYLSNNQDVRKALKDPTRHYIQYGRHGGRIPNRYQHFISKKPPIVFREALLNIVTDSSLKEVLEDGSDKAFELAFELISLGDPVDRTISHFSGGHYLKIHPDVSRAEMDPLIHYLRRGYLENRRTLRDLRAQLVVGSQAFDHDRPSLAICLHEMSETGAPLVGLKIARDAALSHNVLILTSKGGTLQDEFSKVCCHLMESRTPLIDWPYVDVPYRDQLEFALVNSVEAHSFIQPLVANRTPICVYVHEFSDYTYPAYKMTMISLFADKIAFSSDTVRQSWSGVLSDAGVDIASDTAIIPQAQLAFTPMPSHLCVAAREKLSQMIGVDCADRRIVYGAGFIQIRKGTDLFVVAAQQAQQIDPDALFVWIGDGRNHQDLSFGVWLERHAQSAGANLPESNLFFLPAGPDYEDVCRAADVLLLTSRLDPLPNVVFDAVAQGCSVVLFREATGFDDQNYDGLDCLVRVPYGDVAAAARAALKAPGKLSSKRYSKLVPTATHAVPVTTLERIQNLMQSCIEEQEPQEVVDADPGDVSILFRQDSNQELRTREKQRLARLKRAGIWQDPESARAAVQEMGGWMHAQTRIENQTDHDVATVGLPAFSVHLHAYYLDHLEEDFSTIAAYRLAKKLVVTTASPEDAAQIERLGLAAGLIPDVRVVPNRGRDILPFLHVVDADECDDAAIWCHLHQKKSVGSSVGGEIWRSFLLRILAGDERHVSSALTCIDEPGTGLVAAFDPYILGWGESRRILPGASHRLGQELPEHPLLFPVGNMFWTRAGVARSMLALFGKRFAWPGEPLPSDGTVYHLMERLWPAVASRKGLSSVFLNRTGTARI